MSRNSYVGGVAKGWSKEGRGRRGKWEGTLEAHDGGKIYRERSVIQAPFRGGAGVGKRAKGWGGEA